MDKKEIFLQAIHEKKLVKIKANTDEKGMITRLCVPFDYGTGKLPGIRYHFWDLDSPEGSHNLSILPQKLIEIELTDKTFEPANYVKWTPNWKIPRNWGKYS